MATAFDGFRGGWGGVSEVRVLIGREVVRRFRARRRRRMASACAMCISSLPLAAGPARARSVSGSAGAWLALVWCVCYARARFCRGCVGGKVWPSGVGGAPQ
jgi:hypothetical protein